MSHETYIQRCIELAKKGKASAAPNPMVGSVIVCDGKVIGEGYHQQYGEPHAEVNAIASVKDHELLKKSTIYINLEPCAHFGKTPPCSDLIIDKQIPHVVVGDVDPFSLVNGMGIEKMKAAGCKVEVGFLKEACAHLNRRFFTFHARQRPYVILKWAQSADGFIDIHRDRDEKGIHWISHPKTKSLVHKWRSEEAAILVGGKTVVTDNPMLTVREWQGKNPIRVVLDDYGDLNDNARVFNLATETLHFTPLNCPRMDLNIVLTEIFNRNLTSVIIEGGKKTLQKFIDANLWDEARIITGQTNLEDGIEAPKVSGQLFKQFDFAGDQVSFYRNLTNS